MTPIARTKPRVDLIEAEPGWLDRLTRRLLDLARADMTAGSGPGPALVGPVLAAIAPRFADRGLCMRVEVDAVVAIDKEPLESITGYRRVRQHGYEFKRSSAKTAGNVSLIIRHVSARDHAEKLPAGA